MLEPFTLETLAHGTVRVPDERQVTHLMFRRFAGCPACNLHLRSFARRHAELEAAGVRVVAFFHSTAEEMRPFQGDLPFPCVADPERRWYARFGVGRSTLGMLHPAMAWEVTKGLLAGEGNLFKGSGGHDGVSCDFLVGPDGTLRAAKYGTHPVDHWEVDEVLALSLRTPGPRS